MEKTLENPVMTDEAAAVIMQRIMDGEIEMPHYDPDTEISPDEWPEIVALAEQYNWDDLTPAA